MCSATFFVHYYYCTSFHDPRLNESNVAAVTSSHVSHISAAVCREVIGVIGWPSLA
jgi:hypothetical protein